MMLLAMLIGTASADCYFISLRGFDIAKNPDVLLWGDLSPLIALEPGRFYPLTPERKDVVSSSGGHATNLQGHRYYIPQHLINDAGQFSLRMMVIDRDKDTGDDTLLPFREKLITLPAGKESAVNSNPVIVEYAPFADITPPQSNRMRFEFDLRSRTGDCDVSSGIGKKTDSQYRRHNELKRLLVRVVAYEQPALVGGREYLAYRLPEIKSHKLSDGLEKALDIADVNARELLELGSNIYDLRGNPGFYEVWEEYVLLIQHLYKQHIILLYDENKVQKRKRIKVPSLSFHPEWGSLVSRPDSVTPPDNWKIVLPDG